MGKVRGVRAGSVQGRGTRWTIVGVSGTHLGAANEMRPLLVTMARSMHSTPHAQLPRCRLAEHGANCCSSAAVLPHSGRPQQRQKEKCLNTIELTSRRTQLALSPSGTARSQR